MNIILTLPVAELRGCAGCTACCVRIPISAGVVQQEAKPAGTACPHLCNEGCGIHSSRSEQCSAFFCAWIKQNDWPENWKPNQSGILAIRERIDGRIWGGLLYELRPGALQKTEGQAIFERLQANCDVVAVVNYLDQVTSYRGDRGIDSTSIRLASEQHFRHKAMALHKAAA